MEMDFTNYPKFTPEMKKTHKILIPNMAPVQFRILAAAMEREGYTCELLENCGSQVSELGLKYVHNDTCYPALLVIGQFLDALNSGKYDLEHTALLITVGNFIITAIVTEKGIVYPPFDVNLKKLFG